MNPFRTTAIVSALLCSIALTFGCSNPKDDFREVGTEFAQKLVDNDLASLSSLSTENAFGQGTEGVEAIHRTMTRDCGAVQGITEDSVEVGPSVDADATGTATFSLQSEKSCKLTVTMSLRDDETKVERAAVVVDDTDS